MLRLVTLIGGLVLLWAVFAFGGRPHAPVIQEDVRARTAAAIGQAGYDGVTVAVDGRDVTLTGSVVASADIDAAEATASAVRGVRVVSNELRIAEPYHTQFCKDRGILLTGDVADLDAERAFPERARDMFRYYRVEEDLDVRSGAPDGFRRFMDHALLELGQLDEGCITLNDRALLIRGTMRSQRALDLMQERMVVVADLGFNVSYDVSLPELSAQARTCQAEANRRVAPGETVLFDFDSDVVHEAGRELLDEVVEIAALCPQVSVEVSGHTDAVGDKDYNIALSERRAEAVVAYLVEAGMEANRLSAVGMGFSQPVADNSTEAGRVQNRRIEFRAREN
jgi:OOP family OmpA-OmpF porin